MKRFLFRPKGPLKYSRCICILKSMTASRELFVSLQDDESVGTLGVLDVDGWKKQFHLKNALSSVKHVEVAAKRLLF